MGEEKSKRVVVSPPSLQIFMFIYTFQNTLLPWGFLHNKDACSLNLRLKSIVTPCNWTLSSEETKDWSKKRIVSFGFEPIQMVEIFGVGNHLTKRKLSASKASSKNCNKWSNFPIFNNFLSGFKCVNFTLCHFTPHWSQEQMLLLSIFLERKNMKTYSGKSSVIQTIYMHAFKMNNMYYLHSVSHILSRP